MDFQGEKGVLGPSLWVGGHPGDGEWRCIQVPGSRDRDSYSPSTVLTVEGRVSSLGSNGLPRTNRMEGPSQRRPNLFCQMGQGWHPRAMVRGWETQKSRRLDILQVHPYLNKGVGPTASISQDPRRKQNSPQMFKGHASHEASTYSGEGVRRRNGVPGGQQGP